MTRLEREFEAGLEGNRKHREEFEARGVKIAELENALAAATSRQQQLEVRVRELEAMVPAEGDPYADTNVQKVDRLAQALLREYGQLRRSY